MRIDEVLSDRIGDGVYYDAAKNKIKFKGPKPRLTLKALHKAKLQKAAQKKHDKAKQAQWELMYGNKELGEQDSDLELQKRNDHLDKLASSHIKRSLGEADE